MASEDREQQFERALARHLRDASADSACADAETLAAYHERTLSVDEMARWKEHIVGCARCQETLALLEETEQVLTEELEDDSILVPMKAAVASSVSAAAAPALQKPLAKQNITSIAKGPARRSLRWAVPLGAVAAAVIIWVGVRERDLQRERRSETVQIAKNEPAMPAMRESAPEAMPQKPAGTSAKTEGSGTKALETELRAKKISPPSVPNENAQKEESRSLAADQLDRKQDQQKDIGGMITAGRLATEKRVPGPRRSADAAIGGLPSAAPQVTSGVAGNRSRDEEVQALKKKVTPSRADQVVSGGVAGAAGVAPAAPAQVNAEAVTVQPETQPSGATESVEVQAESKQPQANQNALEITQSAKLGKAGFLQTVAGDRRYVVAPDERQVWQVGSSGEVLRTTNFGKSWKAQNSGVNVDLVSGSAPSHDVCWLIGKAGTILLTTDGGKVWKQVSSPTNNDLGSIVATDAKHATVWDAARQKSYRTEDGGETWKPALP